MERKDLMKIFHKKAKKNSTIIAKEMYVKLILTIILPVFATGIFMINYLYNVLYQQSLDQLKSDNLRVKSIMVDCFINTYNIADDLLSDKTLQAYLISEDVSTSDFPSVASSRITNYLVSNTYISSIHIYTSNSTLEQNSYLSTATDEIKAECFHKSNIPGYVLWGIYPSVSRDRYNPELTLLCTFPMPKSEYSSILAITLSSNFLRNRIKNNTLTNMMTVNSDNIFFSTIRSLQETPLPIEVNQNKRYLEEEGVYDNYGHKVIGYISSIPIYNSSDTIYFYTYDSKAFKQIQFIGIIFFFITCFLIIVALLGIVFNAKYLSSRILSLRNSMKLAKSGNYEHIIDSLRGKDELTETFTDLKDLITNIKEKDSQMYEAKIKEHKLINEQSKMEFKLLYNQINPHFIYNTLETIRILALEEDNSDVASAIMLLGNCIRYVLETSTSYSTTLDKELNYIHAYLQIQKIRFAERLNYSIHIDDNFSPKQYSILPLLIQPIVENAVIHGLETISQNVIINISIQPQPDNLLIIEITDNGRGIPENELAIINERINSSTVATQSSIGLRNINNRIKLYYGELYSLNIESVLGQGTKASLILPCEKVVDNFS